MSMVNLEELISFAEYLERKDPFSNLYTDFSVSLFSIEEKLKKLKRKILREVKKYKT